MGKLRQVFWEYGTAAKSSSTTVHTADLAVGNIATQETLRDAFLAAIEAVSIGEPGTMEWVAETNDVAKTPSANEAAQRENKWLISFVDNVTGLGGSFTVPCYDSTLIATDGESMEAGTPRTNLVSATEAYVLSNAGNAVTVTGIRFTSRNI